MCKLVNVQMCKWVIGLIRMHVFRSWMMKLFFLIFLLLNVNPHAFQEQMDMKATIRKALTNNLTPLPLYRRSSFYVQNLPYFQLPVPPEHVLQLQFPISIAD